MDPTFTQFKYPAPWTDDQVENLKIRQTRTDVHPYTCSGGGGYCSEDLVPTNDGWKCPSCSFTQDWCMIYDIVEDQREAIKKYEKVITKLFGDINE